jgi:hypothetical protein
MSANPQPGQPRILLTPYVINYSDRLTILAVTKIMVTYGHLVGLFDQDELSRIDIN